MAAQQVQVLNIVQRQDRGGVFEGKQHAASAFRCKLAERGEISLCSGGDAVFPCTSYVGAILFRRQELIARTGVDASAETKSLPLASVCMVHFGRAQGIRGLGHSVAATNDCVCDGDPFVQERQVHDRLWPALVSPKDSIRLLQ